MNQLTAVNQHFKSNKAAATSFHTTPPAPSAPPTCLTPLAAAATFSSSVRNLAVPGESGKNANATAAMTIVGRPSTKSSRRQFARCECPDVIPYAKAPIEQNSATRGLEMGKKKIGLAPYLRNSLPEEQQLGRYRSANPIHAGGRRMIGKRVHLARSRLRTRRGRNDLL